MTRGDFKQKLRSGALPSVMIFEGDDEYLKQSAIKDLEKVLLPPGLESLNRSLLTNPETSDIIDAAETLPVMAAKRLVIVRDMAALTGRAETDDRLIDYLKTLPETCVLVFHCVGKPDARKKLYLGVKKANGVVTFAPMKDRELTAFVISAFKDLGKACTEQTADLLIFTVGTDTALLLSEIGKITYHTNDAAVTDDDVRALATPSSECTVFQMIDAVASGGSDRALKLMRAQLLAGEDRFGLLAMLQWQYRLLRQIKQLQAERVPESGIRQQLGVPPFSAAQYMRHASRYTLPQLVTAVGICSKAEVGMKSGRLPVEGTLESVMLKLLRLKEIA